MAKSVARRAGELAEAMPDDVPVNDLAAWARMWSGHSVDWWARCMDGEDFTGAQMYAARLRAVATRLDRARRRAERECQAVAVQTQTQGARRE